MLETIYKEIENKMNTIQFDSLWTLFKPYPFALYNDKEVYFKGEIFPRTDEFIANTAITYQGEIITIWEIRDTIDSDILTSKMIHEMFHAFQYEHQESRFPNEFESLKKYQYCKENLTIKQEENKLINQLLNKFDSTTFQQLLQLRKYRSIHFPYEFDYESKVEQIEGCAKYIELEVLKRLSKEKYLNELKQIQLSITSIENMIPIRIISYGVGALLLLVLKNNNIPFNQGFSNQTIGEELIQNTNELFLDFDTSEAQKVIEQYYQQTKNQIESIKKDNNPMLEGKFKILGLNVYNAKYLDDYIITTYFLAYEDQGEAKTLMGNYLIEIDHEMLISKIYSFDSI